jgi:hypothetical protein
MSTATKLNGKSGQLTPTQPPIVEIDSIEREVLDIPLIGVTPLIVHRFSEKAKRNMLEASLGKRAPKQPKDPQAEYEDSMYRLEGGGYGVVATSFKKASVEATRFWPKNVSKELIERAIFMHGEIGTDGRALVRIEGEPEMREDPVKIGRSGAEMRYRGQFWPWGVTLRMSYFTAVMNRSSVLSLIDAGGLSSGVGDWRLEKKGEFGSYRVDPGREIEVVI